MVGEKKRFFPVMIDLDQFNILIVGGGKIGYRKACRFDSMGKSVKVVAAQFTDEFKNLEHAEKVEKSFEKSDLDGMDMVYLATDDKKIQEEVCRFCKEKSIMVNRLDEHEDSSFINMGYFCREIDGTEFMFSVSSFGNDPAKTKEIRDGIERYLSEER